MDNTSAPSRNIPSGTGPKKVLIIEDEIPLRKALCSRLLREGFNTIEAEDGKKALELTLQLHPDLILCDIFMPQMDGLEYAKRLREDVWGKTAKVMFLTNLSNSEDVAKAIEYGITDYLVKSDTKLQDIIEKVKEKLAT